MRRRHFISSLPVALGLALTLATPDVGAASDAETLSPAAQAWEATGQYMTIDGHRVFYHDVGEGPVILLLQGHRSSSLDWREVVPTLQKKASVISFDQLGCDLSDKPVRFGYTLMELAERAPQAEYAEIKGIGHFPNAEAPDEIAKQILLATGLQ